MEQRISWDKLPLLFKDAAQATRGLGGPLPVDRLPVHTPGLQRFHIRRDNQTLPKEPHYVSATPPLVGSLLSFDGMLYKIRILEDVFSRWSFFWKPTKDFPNEGKE
jgi:hypothetical protein